MKFYGLAKNEATKLLEKRDLTIAVVGQGKMGLPISVILLESGFSVIGVDSNPKTVDMINDGNPPILEEPGVLEGVNKGLKEFRFTCTLSIEDALSEADIIIVIIPLLLDEKNNPLFTNFNNLMKEIGRNLQKGQFVIVETTLPSGTTNGVFRPILEKKSNLIAGEDFGLGYSPERTASGTVLADVQNKYPKIIGGVNEKSLDFMDEFYSLFAEKGTIRMSSMTAAETVKVFEGVYRDVNIALANEFAKITEVLGLNISSIIDAANSQPYSHIHRPGPGVGGHCIPVYPHFLTKLAEEKGINLNLTKTGRKINSSQPYVVIEKIKEGLELIGKKLENATIVLLGLAFRGGVKESRNSPTFDIVKELKDRTPNLVLTDPLFYKEEIDNLLDIKFEQDVYEAIKNADCIVLLTNHKDYVELTPDKIEKISNKKLVLIDTKQMWEEFRNTNFENVKLVGIGY